MKPEIAKQWVEALRSGKYKQGKQRLCNLKDNTFCCLGVLCEIAKDNGIVLAKDYFEYFHDPMALIEKPSYSLTQMKDDRSYDGMTTSLPQSVMLWAGMKHAQGEIPDGSKYPHGVSIPWSTSAMLTVLNDKGSTFEEIANIIEENVEVL
jgi:hypothetical protein